MLKGMRLGSKFEPRALTFARIICSVLISAVWLTYSSFQLKKALDPPVGLESETVPAEMYVPTIIVASVAGQFDNMDLLVGGLYPDEPSTLKPIGTVEKIENYLNSTFTAFVVTPREALRFGAHNNTRDPMVNAIAIALSTNSTTLAYFPYVGIKSAISAEKYEIVILTSLEPKRPSRVGLDQEITEDLQGRRWTSYASQSQTLALSFFQDYPYAAMLIPLKLAVDNEDKWITQKRKMKRTYTWLDFLSSIGGTLPFATGIYYLLFGVGRVQTWGIIQRFFLRRKVLSQVPDSVLALPGYERVGGKIYSEVTQPNYEKNLVAIDMPMPIPMQQFPSSPSRVDGHSVESRLAQLEAFQQRLDIFYLSHEIFETKKRKERH